jgi:pimeloyl-ACP methyl ester carboxylesterase
MKLPAKLILSWMALASIPQASLGWPAPFVLGPPSDPPFIGLWQAPLMTPRGRLRIVIKFVVEPDGRIRGSLDSPDQGLQNLRLDHISVHGDALEFDFRDGQAHYKGDLKPDKIQGKWLQAGQTISLNFERIQRAPPIVLRPQTPRPPYPYGTEEVTYENRQAGVMLAGTLTTPRSGGPFPAAILLTIAGPEDRDQTAGSHKQFWVLADHLTRKGIAVLRSDNRGVGQSTGNYYDATIHDRATDALAALRFLQSKPAIDKRRIGFIGNSEGGEVAALAAATSPDVAFVVLLAAPGLPGTELIRHQTETMATLQRYSPEQKRIVLEREELIFRILREENENKKALARLKDLTKGSKVPTPTVANLAKANDLDAELRMYVSPWYREMARYDPRPTLAKVECPILAMNGSLDLVVDPQQNLREIHQALLQGKNPDYTLVQLPRLNHLFQTAKTGSPMEYNWLDETFAPLAMTTIGDWIRDRFMTDKD